MNQKDPIEFLKTTSWGRETFGIGLLLLIEIFVIPTQLKPFTISVAAVLFVYSFVNWAMYDMTYPTPYLWWLLWGEISNISDLSIEWIVVYQYWLDFKNTQKITFFDPFTSTEISKALYEVNTQIDQRTS